MPKRTPPFHSRHFLFLTILLGLWVLVIVARLVQLQVLEHESFARRARRQQEQTIEVSPVRGVVYDRNFRPLAMSVEVDSVFAVPAEIPDAEATARLLAPVLRLSPLELARKLEGSRSFRWIKRKVSAQEAARIRQLNLRGIYFQKESKRFYPKRELAAHVLGHVGVDDQGLAGIELSREETIRGQPGQLLIERDARQRWFRRTGRPPTSGQTVVLTLDENIQYIAERELELAMSQTRARSGSVLVQDPHTGEMLALANRPTFNPNTYAEADPEALRNRAISGIYEPGSTLKIVTMSAALEEKLAVPEETLDCQMGAITLAGHTIHDHKPFGLLTVEQAFQYSSDVCAIKLALRVGDEGLYRYLRKFGFGSLTRIELPGEARGLTKPPERWWKASIGAIAMGQEIGVTPLQLLAAASAVAHEGVWLRPRIVRNASPPAPLPPADPLGSRRAVSPETASVVQRMMARVVTDGTGKAARPAGYTAGGKTGTAQKLDPATRTYSLTDHIASFVGFAPAESPLFTILVVLDSPRGRYHGGDVAAPVFRRIAEQILAYRNIPSSEPRPLPLALASWSAAPARATEENFPEAEESFPTAIAAPVSGGITGLVVPNFVGENVRSVTTQALAKRLPVQVVGYGIAYEQFPAAGSHLPERQKIVVRFRVGGSAPGTGSRPQAPALALPAGPVPSASAAALPASG